MTLIWNDFLIRYRSLVALDNHGLTLVHSVDCL
jgi:hypothetical protein